jgi:hypothetical protein
MPCNQNCQQGRDCQCGGSKSDRAAVIVITLLLAGIFAMGYGFYNILSENKDQNCAVEVRFKDSVATYVGKSV